MLKILVTEEKSLALLQICVVLLDDLCHGSGRQGMPFSGMIENIFFLCSVIVNCLGVIAKTNKIDIVDVRGMWIHCCRIMAVGNKTFLGGLV